MAVERDMAGVLMARAPDLDHELARLMATTYLAASRTAGALWLESSGEKSLPELTDRLLSRIHPR
jgi:hypothetical protein